MRRWSFVYVADMQPGSPKSFRFKPAWLENWQQARKQIMALNPDFMLIGGDVTRDGSIHKWELAEMKADFDSMNVSYHVIPGNMDTGNKHTDRHGGRHDRDDLSLNMTSAQLRQFESVFGPSRWSFIHRSVRVSGFCDMLVGSGLPEEEKLWAWFEEVRCQPKLLHHIWLMHYALFLDAPDERLFDITKRQDYLNWYFCVDQGNRERLMAVFKATGTARVITGHIHCRKDHFAEGIHFDLAPATCAAQWIDHWPDGDGTLGFFKYDVEGDRMTKTFVPLEKVSQRTDGYGPGGHPKPEAHDYSLAWEPGAE